MKSSAKYSIVLVVFVSLFLSCSLFFMGTSAEASLEKISLDSDTIRIQTNIGNPVIDVQLIENTDHCFTECYAILKIHPYQNIVLPAQSDSEYAWNFVKEKPWMDGLISYHFEILETTEYQVEVPDYETSNVKTTCYNFDNETKTNTSYECEVEQTVQTGSHQETKYSEDYKPFAFWGETLEAEEDYTIKLVGKKSAKVGTNNVDWVPKIKGLELNEWLWWNTTFKKCRKITNITAANFPIHAEINMSFYNTSIPFADLMANGADLRYTNGTDCNADPGSPMNFYIGTCNTSAASSMCEVWINASENQTSFLVYYNASGVSTASNGLTTWHFFDDFSDNDGSDWTPDATDIFRRIVGGNANQNESFTCCTVDNAWHNYKLIFTGTTEYSYKDDVLMLSFVNSQASNQVGRVRLETGWFGTKMAWDDIMLGIYVASPPSWSIGNEKRNMPPSITVVSPQNITYNISYIDLNWSAGEMLDWAGYSLNDESNVTLDGIIDELNDSSKTENITYSNFSGGSMLVYISIPKMSEISQAKWNMTGFGGYDMDEELEAAWNYTDGISDPVAAEYAYDEIWTSHSMALSNKALYVNYTNQGSNVSAVNVTFRWNPDCSTYGGCSSSGNISVYCMNSTNNWEQISNIYRVSQGCSSENDYTEKENIPLSCLSDNKVQMKYILSSDDFWCFAEEKLTWLWPKNITIDTGNDDIKDYINTTSFNSTETIDLNVTAIINYLATCSPDLNGYCNVPFNISSDTGGILEIDNITIDHTSNLTITSLEGQNNLIVWANNTAGMNYTTVYFTVDTTPPLVIIDSPQNITYNNLSIWFNLTSNEDIDSCLLDYGYGNISLTNSSGNWNYNNASMINGVYEAIFYCNDTVGNSNSTSVDFTVDAYEITFNVTSGEDGSSLDNVNIVCNYTGFGQDGDTTNPYGPYEFPSGWWSCTFSRESYYNKTVIFTADNDKTVNVTLSVEKSLTIEEHNWLEDIYNCLINKDCDVYDLWNQTYEYASNIWDQFKQTDESVVVSEETTSSVVNDTSNLTIEYVIDVPTKEDYQFLPIRIFYWFMDENNETCYNQAKETNSAEAPFCNPLVAQTIGEVDTQISFTVDLRPNLPEGNYTIVRRIDIDPENVWINYGHETIGRLEVTGDSDASDIQLAMNGNPIKHETQTTATQSATETEQFTGDKTTGMITVQQIDSVSYVAVIVSVITLVLVGLMYKNMRKRTP
ncbi:MAG: DUF2341 domain-containing protein [Candidatus Aenigmarchaeota archaeon]|nr:DUF2341 domain-containing protein [Candidatus Aenigmarchaeota archaeon]